MDATEKEFLSNLLSKLTELELTWERANERAGEIRNQEILFLDGIKIKSQENYRKIFTVITNDSEDKTIEKLNEIDVLISSLQTELTNYIAAKF